MQTTNSRELALGEYMAVAYQAMLELYRDPDIASVAAAAMVNDLLAKRAGKARAEAG